LPPGTDIVSLATQVRKVPASVIQSFPLGETRSPAF
jgi:hypothetical protein